MFNSYGIYRWQEYFEILNTVEIFDVRAFISNGIQIDYIFMYFWWAQWLILVFKKSRVIAII